MQHYKLWSSSLCDLLHPPTLHFMNKNIIHEMLILIKKHIILPVFRHCASVYFSPVSGQFICYSAHKSCCDHGQTLVLQASSKAPLAYVTTYMYCAAQSNYTAAQCSKSTKLHCDVTYIVTLCIKW